MPIFSDFLVDTLNPNAAVMLGSHRRRVVDKNIVEWMTWSG